jgi:hypothetical protein
MHGGKARCRGSGCGDARQWPMPATEHRHAGEHVEQAGSDPHEQAAELLVDLRREAQRTQPGEAGQGAAGGDPGVAKSGQTRVEVKVTPIPSTVQAMHAEIRYASPVGGSIRWRGRGEAIGHQKALPASTKERSRSTPTGALRIAALHAAGSCQSHIAPTPAIHPSGAMARSRPSRAKPGALEEPLHRPRRQEQTNSNGTRSKSARCWSMWATKSWPSARAANGEAQARIVSSVAADASHQRQPASRPRSTLYRSRANRAPHATSAPGIVQRHGVSTSSARSVAKRLSFMASLPLPQQGPQPASHQMPRRAQRPDRPRRPR